MVVGDGGSAPALAPPLSTSALCTEAGVTSEPILRWADRLRPAWDPDHGVLTAPLNRKIWEWSFILAALDEQKLLRPGSRGLGFGVGQDPLTAIIASLGCEVVATDLEPDQALARGWVQTGQYGGGVERLNGAGLCDPGEFAKRVGFETVDMNRIPAHLRHFDFTWSACAFEHLGSIARGQEFILEQMRCLRPGGVAVHTTEFNVFSNGPTITSGETVLFRRRDIEWLVQELRADGHVIEVDFDAGSGPADRYVDVPPWHGPHLKLQVGEFVSTSLALVIRASPSSPSRRRRWHRAARRRLVLDRPRLVPAFDAVVRFRRSRSA